jgi:hypothetical protein
LEPMAEEITEKMTPADALMALLKELVTHGETLVETITFNKRDARQSFFITSYLSLLELTDNLLFLIESKKHIALPMLNRSILETFVDIENLYVDNNYYKCMLFNMNIYNIFKLENARNGNPYFSDIASMSNRDTTIDDLKRQNKSLTDDGIQRLNIKQRFHKAGFDNEYEAIFKFLSDNTHSTLNALFYRHFERAEDDYQIVYARELPPERLLIYLDTSVGLLLAATKRVNERFGDKNIDRYQMLEDERERIRKHY